ncbi:hypothetical protein [Vulcaniibacterium gelatinicum]|uniref:hypothetical protein n=1 Tax=Vulcaniibacterium gelatinicum TaxID=2598725 RepID=UPI0011CC9279|nr:hypothetical protein [Vulcaniibacterium gelatinicum]
MTRLALVLAAALAATPALAQQGPDIDKVNGSITAEAGRSYGKLDTVNGSIRIEADARTGDAETVNGSIRVAGQARTGDLGTVNGSVRVGSQAVVDGGIETVNGSVFVDRGSRVAAGVETVNGAIGLVDTDLGGGIETVNGDVTVGIGSHVRGGLTVRKPQAQWIRIGKQRPPRIVIGPNARVDGPLVFEREVRLYVHETATIGPVTGAIAVRYSGARAPKD